MGFQLNKKNKKKTLPSFDFKCGFCWKDEGQYVEHLKPHAPNVVPFAYLFIYLSTLYRC